MLKVCPLLSQVLSFPFCSELVYQMVKIEAETGAYDLVFTDDWMYYRISLTRLKDKPYGYFKNDLTQNIEVTEQEFNLAKYRAPITPRENGEEVIFMPDGNTLRCYFQDSIVRIFSPTGALLRELPSSIEAVTGIYSIALDADGHLWTALPSYHQVAQYEITSGTRLYELGGSWDPGEFNHPEDISIYDGYAFISDMGNYRIVLLDTNKKSFGTYRTFEQPVWQYRRFKDKEIVRLSDGIYTL